MKRIVVAMDGSPCSINALRWAGSLADECGAEMIAMAGLVPKDSATSSSRFEELRDAHMNKLVEWCDAADIGEADVRSLVVNGDPRPAVLQVASDEHADLIVIGRVGSSAGPGLLHIGSMAEWLAHHADRVVAVVGGAVNTSIRRVIVGVDGSDGSQAALDWVADLAQHCEIEIVVTAVTDDSVTWAAPPDSAERRALVEDRVRTDWARRLTKRNVPFRVNSPWGTNHADALLEAACDERADLVVVGMRGIGGFTGLRIGGVALKVLHRTDRPLVLVPPERR